MKTTALVPPCSKRVKFDRREIKMMSTDSGCYALSNHEDKVLYVGQAKCLRDRMENHLSNPEKTAMTKLGKAFWFYYLASPLNLLDRIELGWNQQYEDAEGCKPILNKVRPPAR